VRTLDAEAVEQPDAVVGHVGERVGRRARVAAQELADRRRPVRRELRRSPDVAVVVADHAEAGRGELLAEPRAPPEHLCGEAHDEQHGRVGRIPERLVGELDVADPHDLLWHAAHRTRRDARADRSAECRG
jgi:hypothetical protein